MYGIVESCLIWTPLEPSYSGWIIKVSSFIILSEVIAKVSDVYSVTHDFAEGTWNFAESE